MHYLGSARQIRKKREVPMPEESRIKQVLAWDVTLLPSTMVCRYYYLYMVKGG